MNRICTINSSKYNPIKFIGLLVFPLLLYIIPIEWLNGQHTICLFKNIFGRECYGCGITRAILSAIHFDFEAALNFNKLVVIVLPLFVYVWIKKLLKLWDKNWMSNSKSKIDCDTAT